LSLPNPSRVKVFAATDSKEIIDKFLYEVFSTSESDFLLKQIRHALAEIRFCRFEHYEWLAKPGFWLSIVHREDNERVTLDAAETFASRAVGTNHFRWIAKDGKVIWVKVKSIAICDETGNSIGIRAVAVDICHQRRAEEFQARQTQLKALRAGIIPAFASKGSLQEILQQCAEALVRNLDANWQSLLITSRKALN
jgi:hypothetical protein